MRRYKLITIGLAALICLGCVTVIDSSQQEKLFLVESGKMVSELTGVQNGTETLWWEKWGLKQRKETHTVMEIMGMKQESSAVQIILGNEIYTLDEASHTASKITADMFEGMSGDDKRAMGYQMLEAMGGKQVGKENILGKPCEIWLVESQMQAKTWLWKGITLKSEVNAMGMPQKVEAIDLDVETSPGSSLFDVSGYKIQDLGGIQDIMGQ